MGKSKKVRKRGTPLDLSVGADPIPRYVEPDSLPYRPVTRQAKVPRAPVDDMEFYIMGLALHNFLRNPRMTAQEMAAYISKQREGARVSEASVEEYLMKSLLPREMVKFEEGTHPRIWSARYDS